MSYVGSPIIPRQGAAVPDGDTPIYDELVNKLLLDPLPVEEVLDDHHVDPVDPGWFLPFDDVDSRTIRDVGVPP